MADHLRHGEDVAQSQSLITESLIETVTPSPGVTTRDWRFAHGYLRAHLVEHAAACGRLAELVSDPLFVLQADPIHLLAALNKHSGEVQESITRTYRSVMHQLPGRSLAEGASHLEMTARCNGAQVLAERAAALGTRECPST